MSSIQLFHIFISGLAESQLYRRLVLPAPLLITRKAGLKSVSVRIVLHFLKDGVKLLQVYVTDLFQVWDSTVSPALIILLAKNMHIHQSSIPKLENKESLIFHKDYKPLRTQTINSHLLDTCRKPGIRYFSTHKIRAWGITEALASGMYQASVMRIAGHASPQTMRHYVRTARIQKDIGEKFDSVFN